MALIKIHNRNLTNVVWLNAGQCSFKINDNTDLWRIRVSEKDDVLKNLLTIMTDAEVERGNRFFQLKDKQRHISTRGALRLILSGYLKLQPKAIGFLNGENDKPFIGNSNPNNLHFNISHSGEWILIGVTNTALGVDVERIKPDFNYQEIISLNFSPKEINYIVQNEPLERFFSLWTRKEAFLKATGQGLNDNLTLFSCLDGTNITDGDIVATSKNWFISSFKLDELYPASVANSTQYDELHFFEFAFST